MKHSPFKTKESALDGFTDAFKIVFGASTLTGRDNTTAGLTQSITLTPLNQGDIVYPQVALEVITPVAGVATCTASVGVTGALTQLTAASDMKAAVLVGTYVAPGSTVAYATVATSKNLLLSIITTTDNIDQATAGEIWVHVKISRVRDRVTARQF